MIPLISSLEISNVVCEAKSEGHVPNTFWWIASSVVDAAAVNPNGIKGSPVFSNSP